MRYLSVCSGVEAASVAWEHLGWTPVGFSEIEPFPSAVLKHRFPNVPNFGDMTKYKEWPIEPGTVDVLVGGTPCQSFSVAGLRKGLDDPRGSLMLTFLGLAEHLQVPWLVWENVPGVLSSNGGRDFGSFLGALGQLGFRWAYRVLDAQHFGVPQRRRRVFVVAHLGDRGDPAKVLFEPESVCWDHPKSRAKAEKIARGARPGAESGGRTWPADVAPTLNATFGTKQGLENQHALGGAGCFVPGPFWNGQDVAEALTTTSNLQRMPDKGRMQMVVQPVSATVTSKWAKGVGGPAGSSTEYANTVVTQADIAGPLDANYWKGPGSRQGGEREYVGVVTATGPVTHALTVSDGATEDDTGRGTPIVPAIAFHPTQDPISSVEVTHAMGTGSRQGTATVAVAFDTTQITSPKIYSSPKPGDPCHPLAAGAHPPAVVTGTLSSRATATDGLGTDFEVAGGLQAVPMVNMQGSKSNAVAQEDGPSYTLNAMHGHDVHAVLQPTTVLRLDNGSANPVAGEDLSPTIRQGAGPNGTANVAVFTQPTMAVRRLLPVECERLQGFPDGWTDIPWRGKPAPDGPRYKAMGNSMAVPVMRFIGERLDRVVRGEL